MSSLKRADCFTCVYYRRSACECHFDDKCIAYDGCFFCNCFKLWSREKPKGGEGDK